MEIFEKLMEALGHTPAWVPLVLAPALLVFAKSDRSHVVL